MQVGTGSVAGSTAPITVTKALEHYGRTNPWETEVYKAHITCSDSDQNGSVTRAEFDKYLKFEFEKGGKRSADGKPFMCHPKCSDPAVKTGTSTALAAAFTRCNAFVTDATCDADTTC